MLSAGLGWLDTAGSSPPQAAMPALDLVAAWPVAAPDATNHERCGWWSWIVSAAAMRWAHGPGAVKWGSAGPIHVSART